MNYRKIASKQDQRVSQETGWRIEVNSGAVKGKKGDLKSFNLFIETKTKVELTDSFSLQENWFNKLHDQAFNMGKELAILVFSFGDRENFAAMGTKVWSKLFDPKEYASGLYIMTLDRLLVHKKSRIIKRSSLVEAQARAIKLGLLRSIVKFDFGTPVEYVGMNLDLFNEYYNLYNEKTNRI